MHYMSKKKKVNKNTFIKYDFATDNHFTELKEQEIMKERLDLLSSAESYIGKYFSNSYVRKNILNQTDEEIEVIDQEIQSEGGGEGEDDDSDGFGGF